MNIVVTGGTDGIGLALVKKLLLLNYNVFMVGKKMMKPYSLNKTMEQ